MVQLHGSFNTDRKNKTVHSLYRIKAIDGFVFKTKHSNLILTMMLSLNRVQRVDHLNCTTLTNMGFSWSQIVTEKLKITKCFKSFAIHCAPMHHVCSHPWWNWRAHKHAAALTRAIIRTLLLEQNTALHGYSSLNAHVRCPFNNRLREIRLLLMVNAIRWTMWTNRMKKYNNKLLFGCNKIFSSFILFLRI